MDKTPGSSHLRPGVQQAGVRCGHGTVVTEIWQAWRGSRALLAIYRRVRKEQPQLHRKALYERILSEWILEPGVAAFTVTRAHRSFCEWPVERELRFRDVVLYALVDEYLRSHPTHVGTRTNMSRIVARVVPVEL